MLLWRDGLAKLVRQGIAEGELKKNLDPPTTALALIAIIEGGIMISKLTGKSLDRRRARSSIEEFIKGLQL